MIYFYFIMQSAAQLLFAQNPLISVCDIFEKVEASRVAIYSSTPGRNIHEETSNAFRIGCERYCRSILARGYPRGHVAC